jgi:hypothetical protein
MSTVQSPSRHGIEAWSDDGDARFRPTPSAGQKRASVGRLSERGSDVLIDYGHSILCLDEARQMLQKVKGERIPLVEQARTESEPQIAETLVISVRIAGNKDQPVRLLLDSGIDVPLLYDGGKSREQALQKRSPFRWRGSDGAEQLLVVFDPQDILIGTHSVGHISFVASASKVRKTPEIEADGLLPTALFQRICISYNDHYAVFDTK